MKRNIKTDKRIINVSNRLPVKIVNSGGSMSYVNSEGGLATSLGSVFSQYDSLWIGWPGSSVKDEEKEMVVTELEPHKLHPVFLSAAEINDFYEGFSNETLWPLFHNFPTYSSYHPQYWEAYKNVNQKYADEIIKVATENDIIWIHDYHLMLLPQMVRKALPGIVIGFFQHIPFPTHEIFMALPWRKEILMGLTGADIIGFQTPEDVRHFTESANLLSEISFVANEATVDNRKVIAEAFPISIDYKKYFDLAHNKATKEQEKKIKDLVGDNKLIISIDRLDYSKGILQRLQAVDRFLQLYPEWCGKITMVHLIVPSRDTVKNYKDLKEEMNKLVSEINGKYATICWQPIKHFYQSFQPCLLSALYKMADVALVTPLRDGMNLVSKEFIASNVNHTGVLVLGESAGAARELSDALIVNPHDINDYANKLYDALTMPREEKKQRMQRMQDKIANADIFNWANSFIDKLLETKKCIYLDVDNYDHSSAIQHIDDKFCFAGKRLIMLDYDGTLMPFFNKPEAAAPDDNLLQLLAALSADPNNSVAIVSGRDHETMDTWLGGLDMDFVAEHGAWYKEAGGEWHVQKGLKTDWKIAARSLLEQFTKVTPGSFIEEKAFSLAWHYRNCDAATGKNHAREIATLLEAKLVPEIQLLNGNKVVEIKNSMVNKGTIARKLISREKYDFIMAIGDDVTDEDMFRMLPATAVSIKVGTNITQAAYCVSSYKDVRSLLQKMCDSSAHTSQGHLQLAS